MTEMMISALELRLQKQLEGAELALAQGRYEPAITAAGAVLREQPACLPVRAFLRRAQLAHNRRGPNIFIRFLHSCQLRWARGQLRRHPARAVAVADQVLQMEINQPMALGLLGRAATVLGWSTTAIFAYDCAHLNRPHDAELALALGHALLAGQQAAPAMQVAETVLQRQPHHVAAQHLRQQAALAVALAQGNWEAPGSYREKLRDLGATSAAPPPPLR